MSDEHEHKHIDISEFREFGYLQEVNRRFFHPLGLALMIREEQCPACYGFGRPAPRYRGDRRPEREPCKNCDGSGRVDCLGGIWDSRDDPEGFIYQDGLLDAEKAERVQAEMQRFAERRQQSFGWDIQPVEPTKEEM